MTRGWLHRNPWVVALIASAGAVVALSGAGPDQPTGGKNPPPPPAKQPELQARQPDDGPGPRRWGDGWRGLTRERLQQHLQRLSQEMREDSIKLDEAIKKLEAGGSPEDVRPLLQDRLGLRMRDRGNDGGLGGPGGPEAGAPDDGPPGSEGNGPPEGRRMGPPRGDRTFTDSDWEAVTEIVKKAQPEMLEKLTELRKSDPAGAQKKMLEAYPRLFPLLDLYRNDRRGFDLRLDEIVNVRQSFSLAREIHKLRKEGAGADDPKVTAARTKLREIAGKQFENRLALMQHDIEMLQSRIEKKRAEIEEQRKERDKAIDRSVDMMINQAGDDKGPPGEHPGGRRGRDRDGKDGPRGPEPKEPNK